MCNNFDLPQLFKMKDLKLKPQSMPAMLRIGGISSIPAVLENLGIDVRKTLIESGIEPALLEDSDNLVTYAARDRLIAAGLNQSGCPHFGLLVGSEMNLQSLGLVGILVKNTDSVKEALNCLVRYLYLHSQGSQMQLVVDDELATLSYASIYPDLEMDMQVGDGSLALMLNVMIELCGPEFIPAEVHFAHRMPGNTKPYQRMFGAPLWFNEEQNALIFSSSWLDIPLPGKDVVLKHILEKQIATLEVRHSFSFREQVRSVLNANLRQGQIKEDDIAAIFSIHSRTLNRRLASSGSGFQELLDECRYQYAVQMLADTSVSVAEIASLLGYSRSSSFIRSFRRWSCTTPALWRATHQKSASL